MIVIEMCNQKFYSGTCKSDKEIKEFLEDNFFYFGNQETLVNRLLYDYSDGVDFDFSENGEGDIETYYPLMKIYRSQIYQNIEAHNEKKVEVVEIMYGFDEIEIDDYYFQIDDVTDRGREFVNQKSIRKINDKVSSYVDKERQNRPQMIFFLGFNNNGKYYERKNYNLLDMLGTVGGLQSFIELAALVLLFVFNAHSVPLAIVNAYLNNKIEYDLTK